MAGEQSYGRKLSRKEAHKSQKEGPLIWFLFLSFLCLFVAKNLMLDLQPPSFEAFEREARQGNVVPVVRSVLADLHTPVGTFMRIAGNSHERADRRVQVRQHRTHHGHDIALARLALERFE